jgi:sugar lactone lactonase YvrE
MLIASALFLAWTATPLPVLQDADLLVGSWATHSIRRYQDDGGFAGNFVAPGVGGLDLPDGMALGADGNVYVSSSNSNSVLEYDGCSGEFLGAFIASGLNAPGNLQFGPDGNLYVCNKNTGQVLRFHPGTGAPLGVFAGGGGLLQPVGLLWSGGLLYVSDFAGNAIRRYDATTGAFVDVFATVPTPLILNLDAGGNVMVSSHQGDNILRFDPTGAPLGPFLVGGPVSCPVGYVFDGQGELIVASWQNHRLLRYDAASGAYLGIFAFGAGLALPNDLLWRPSPTVATYCTAKLNACGGLPAIASSGTPSALGAGSFVVSATGTHAGLGGVLMYTDSGAGNLPFLGGTLCLDTAGIRRSVPVQDGSGTPGQCDGTLAIDMNAFALGLLGGDPSPALLSAGTQVHCQFWGRGPGGNALLSDALSYSICQ